MSTETLAERILFINDDCLVLNKLPGEAMEGAKAGMIDLAGLLAEHYGVTQGRVKPFAPTAVHRLDVPVTGCALFARTPRALSFLQTAFARGEAEKYYWAAVELSAALQKLPETGELVHWLETDAKHNKSMAYDTERPNSKRGVLRYRIRGMGQRYAFLEIELITGRHHQIRAQLAALALRIKGDLKYGAARSEKGGGIRLHARSLAFPDPSVPGSIIRVAAPPPIPDRLWQDFEEAA
ncbi:RNA pseudouridine synthase [Spirochaetia bacterium]|nr:RNA pseudouridine synthase [Spirochaetia bacterium]